MEPLTLLSVSVCIALFISNRKSDFKIDEVEKWINITTLVGQQFCFTYNKKQSWGSTEYLAKKIIRLTKTEIEIENFDGSTFKLPHKGLKQFSHPYSHLTRLEIKPECPTIETNRNGTFSIQGIGKDGSSRTMLVEQITWSTTGGTINKTKPFEVVYQPDRIGSFKFSASLGSFSASTKVTVRNPVMLMRLDILPCDLALDLGETLLLTASGKDQYNQLFAINEIQWLVKHTNSQGDTVSDAQLVEVNNQSLPFKAEIPGKFIITAKAGSIEGNATVTVKEPAKLAALKISPSTVNLISGQKQHFTVSGTDQYGCGINVGIIEWQASGGYISVDGNFSVETADQYTITAKVGDLRAKAYAVVTEPSRLTSLVIEPIWAEIQLGQTRDFTATGRDQWDQSMPTNVVEWQTTAGHIDSSGIFKATILGNCTVTANSGGVSSQVDVIVTSNINIPANLIELELKDPVTLEPFRTKEIVYYCTVCQLGHHEDSWEWIHRQCYQCKSDQNVDVYKLPGIFLAKAARYHPKSKIDLRLLKGQGSDGNLSPLSHALTGSGQENSLRFVYVGTQGWGSREFLARRVLSIHETQIEVEDFHGNIIWLPIVLLVAVIAVPIAAKGAFLSGLVVWALKVYVCPGDGCLPKVEGTVQPDEHVDSSPGSGSEVECLGTPSENRPCDLSKQKDVVLIGTEYSSNRYILVRKVAQRSRQLRSQNRELTDQQLITQAIEEVLGA